MSKVNIEVVSEEREYDGYFKIDKATVKETKESGESITYDRFKLTRPDAVAVVVYNADEDTVVLVKQHRYPTHRKVTDDIFEIVAGKMDKGEDPKQTAIREVEEEIGYKIKEENLLYKSSFFASPGYSSEIIHLFVARVTNSDKVTDGGGVAGEHENIEIHHIPAPRFFEMFAEGEIVDAKSIIGANALWHLRNDGRVKIGLDYYEKLRLDRAKEIADKVINDPEAQDNANETSK
ncbi:MAG: NUDIX hydrolase [Nanoarchaeota archaeon]